MPHHLKIHSIFHACQLKLYFVDVEDKDQGKFGRAQIFITPPIVDKQIGTIIYHQLFHDKGWKNLNSQFPINWKGIAPKEAT